MINRENDAYESYFKPVSIDRDTPYNVTDPYNEANPDVGGQMYIGLRMSRRTPDGSEIEEFVNFDETYISSMFERHENGVFRGRDLLVDCEPEFEEDFMKKIVTNKDLKEGDLKKMKCLPAEYFRLYRDMSTGNYSSVNVVISECGGELTNVEPIKIE